MIARASTFLGPNGLFQSGGTPSLVLSLDAGNVLSYSGTGITWSDLSVFHNDTFFSSLENPTYSVSGGGSFQFSGVYDSFVLATFSNGFPINDSQYTIETWINPDNFNQECALLAYGTPEINALNGIGIVGNKLSIDWGGSPLVSPTQSMIVGNWYNVVSTYDGTDRKIYLNGNLIASDTPGFTNSITTGDYLTIGNPLGQYYSGKISIVKIHTKALSAGKLLSNFNSLKTRFGYVFGSMTFDETQNSHVYSSSDDYAFGTNDFTVEAFFKLSNPSVNSDSGIVSLRDNTSYPDGVNINITNATTPYPNIEFSAGGNYISSLISTDNWYHVAISRTGTASSFYVNGQLVTEVVDTVNYANTELVIGRYYTTLDDLYFNGVISNVKVVNGIGLYTSNFTPPSAPLSSTTNTKLLVISQQTTPTADAGGLLQTLTASNVGWTSSLPALYVTNGLICYLDGNNYTSGSTWYDLSGNGNNATLYNGYAYNATNGGVVRFDGGQFTRGEINLDLTGTPCTIIYGTRYLQNTPGFRPSGRSLGGKNNNWLLGTWYNKVKQFYSDSSGFIYGNSPSDTTDTDWHIYTGTIVGRMKFFNNETKLIDLSPGGNGPNGIVLGSDKYNESSNCDISFVLVYDRVLDDSEIQTNFNYFRGRLGL